MRFSGIFLFRTEGFFLVVGFIRSNILLWKGDISEEDGGESRVAADILVDVRALEA
jgi:hypothetical protein